MGDGWHSADVAAQQMALAADEMARWEAGTMDHPPFDAFVASLRKSGVVAGSLLDVGCGGGYYSDVLAKKFDGWTYAGCDYSRAMLDVARARFPDHEFDEGEQTLLPYGDDSFDVVMNAAALIHLEDSLDWSEAIRECGRVARRWVVLHRVPVVAGDKAIGRTVDHKAYGTTIRETYQPRFVVDQMILLEGLELAHRWTWRQGNDPEYDTLLIYVPDGWGDDELI